METAEHKTIFTAKDLETDQEVRWCPGCGDYVILKSLQKVLPELGRNKEEFVFVSGIGCSSRLPYYMETYGMHSIHGRATAIALGLKTSRPELSVWVITGDGDALSIGGNHLIHTLRRNPDLNILLFNNQIYGLTKGQYSPTSEQGKITKSSPAGTTDSPFNPASLALGANGTFVARTMDRDPKHQQDIYKRAYEHKGCSFVEIYQNCNVFNDGAFDILSDKDSKPLHTVFLEQGKPLLFAGGSKCIVLEGMQARVAETAAVPEASIWIHNEKDPIKAYILARFQDNPELPRPFGVIYCDDNKPSLDHLMNEQISRHAIADKQSAFDKLLKSGNTWEVI